MSETGRFLKSFLRSICSRRIVPPPYPCFAAGTREDSWQIVRLSTSTRVRRRDRGPPTWPRRRSPVRSASRRSRKARAPRAAARARPRPPSRSNDARQRPEPLGVLQRHGLDAASSATCSISSRTRVCRSGMSPPVTRANSAPTARNPRGPRERALALGRSRANRAGAPNRHRRFGRVGGKDDDDLGTHLTQPEDGVLQQRHPSVGLGQLVAAEPRRAPAR